MTCDLFEAIPREVSPSNQPPAFGDYDKAVRLLFARFYEVRRHSASPADRCADLSELIEHCNRFIAHLNHPKVRSSEVKRERYFVVWNLAADCAALLGRAEYAIDCPLSVTMGLKL